MKLSSLIKSHELNRGPSLAKGGEKKGEKSHYSSPASVHGVAKGVVFGGNKLQPLCSELAVILI